MGREAISGHATAKRHHLELVGLVAVGQVAVAIAEAPERLLDQAIDLFRTACSEVDRAFDRVTAIERIDDGPRATSMPP